MRWFPWIDAELNSKAPAATNNNEPITDPPCKMCQHWNPQVTFRNGDEGQFVDGVRLCHAKGMEPDFSCFSSKEADSGQA